STAVVDSSDFIPRRSRRSTHRKHVGHRTELGTFTHKPSQWDAEEVSQFLQLQGYGQYSESFSNNEIDGQSMFLLREHHLMERFQMKLGPALTLINIISRLRHPPTS
ncbi:PREDICTED: polyhomeotic-like protein 2, partial [Amphimedon queenslandica]